MSVKELRYSDGLQLRRRDNFTYVQFHGDQGIFATTSARLGIRLDAGVLRDSVGACHVLLKPTFANDLVENGREFG